MRYTAYFHLFSVHLANILPKPTGCQIVQAQADALTSGGKRDRRVLTDKVRETLREVAKRAAQEAAQAAQDGEL